MRRRAVITGGAGFIGSHLAEQLLARDMEVVCLDNVVTGSPDNVAHLQGHENFRLLNVDVTGYVSVPGPVDYVLHFASPASPVDYAELPIQTLKAGSLGTLHALGPAKEKGTRYLLASTSEIYGDPRCSGVATASGPRDVGAASSARWCSELARCSGPNGGNRRYSRMNCGTADQS